MANTGKARLAHELINDIADGYTPDHNDLETLRSFLPELPDQKTLEELNEEVKNIWGATVSNYWPEETHGVLEVWLWEHHKQLEGLIGNTPETSQASQAAPGLPEGMKLATHPAHGLCVVSPATDEDGDRRIFYLSTSTDAGADSRWVPVVHLTFLDEEAASPESLEDEEPHPEFLQGEADYHHAPGGTIVVYGKSAPFVKWNNGWITPLLKDASTAAEMGATRRRVLRWGFGDE